MKNFSKKNLGPRLEAILAEILPGAPLWDLFCDHGYLGLKANALNLCSEVHFVDKVPDIIMKLVKSSLYNQEIDQNNLSFHTRDARELDPSKISGTVILAGVGYHLLEDTLKAFYSDNLLFPHNKTKFLCLPHQHIDRFREFIMNFDHLELIKTIEITERKRERTLFILRPSAL